MYLFTSSPLKTSENYKRIINEINVLSEKLAYNNWQVMQHNIYITSTILYKHIIYYIQSVSIKNNFSFVLWGETKKFLPIGLISLKKELSIKST